MVEAISKQATGKRIVASGIPGTRMLGLKVRRPSELVRRVKTGFRFAYLVNLEKQSGLTREQLAQLVAIPQRTLARRQREGQLSSEESDRLLRGAHICEMVANLFEGDKDEARRWLLASNPALGGASPLEFTSTEVGAREVEHLIGRLEHGVFT